MLNPVVLAFCTGWFVYYDYSVFPRLNVLYNESVTLLNPVGLCGLAVQFIRRKRRQRTCPHVSLAMFHAVQTSKQVYDAGLLAVDAKNNANPYDENIATDDSLPVLVIQTQEDWAIAEIAADIAKLMYLKGRKFAYLFSSFRQIANDVMLSSYMPVHD